MIKLPPNHYCIIKNPIVRDEDGEIVRYFFVNVTRLRAPSTNQRSASKSSRSEAKSNIRIPSPYILTSSYTRMSRSSFSLKIMRHSYSRLWGPSLTRETVNLRGSSMTSTYSRDRAHMNPASRRKSSRGSRLWSFFQTMHFCWLLSVTPLTQMGSLASRESR
jgi:hypothetical protein